MLMAAQKRAYQGAISQPDDEPIFLILGLDPMEFFKQFYADR